MQLAARELQLPILFKGMKYICLALASFFFYQGRPERPMRMSYCNATLQICFIRRRIPGLRQGGIIAFGIYLNP